MKRLGDWVVSLGSPFGLQNTATVGIISSLSRKITEIGSYSASPPPLASTTSTQSQPPNSTGGGIEDSRIRYLQHDCVVHSGSSGGPLINLSGKVIGINTTRAEGEGLSFAIRIDLITEMVTQLLQTGRIKRPFLGVHLMSLTKAVWKQLKESGDDIKVAPFQSGILITNVPFSF